MFHVNHADINEVYISYQS